jgi:hypothetical protein
MEAIMSILRLLVAFLLAASSAYVIVYAVREAAVAPASVRASVTQINRPQPMLSEPNARTADREQLRKYFLQGRSDGLRRVLP